jgi:hypothetical protein
MAQPVDGAQYKRISGTGAGTTVVLDRPGNWRCLFIGQTKTGTVTLYDVATASGTAAGNFVTEIVNANSGVPIASTPNLKMRYGLVAVAGGTTDLLIGID